MHDTDVRPRVCLAAALAVVVCLTVAVVLGDSAHSQSGGCYDLTWNTIDAGGGGSAGGAYALTATVGQPDAGIHGGGTYALRSGFWFGAIPAPGDCNNDAVVDAGDISALILEIFDADLSSPEHAPESTFVGDPDGCNANKDVVIDAGDISCAILLIFNGPWACGA